MRVKTGQLAHRSLSHKLVLDDLIKEEGRLFAFKNQGSSQWAKQGKTRSQEDRNHRHGEFVDQVCFEETLDGPASVDVQLGVTSLVNGVQDIGQVTPNQLGFVPRLLRKLSQRSAQDKNGLFIGPIDVKFADSLEGCLLYTSDAADE